MTTTRAASYARYSSDVQKDRSVDDQLALCASRASHEGLKVVASFSDRGKSGTTMFERDGLHKLVEAARRKQFTTLVVEKLDRLARDQGDLQWLWKVLTYEGIKILTLSEGYATPMHIGVSGLKDSFYSKDLGDRIRMRNTMRVRDGKFPGSITYGYRAVQGKPGEREIDADEAKVVRRLFREYAAAVSPRAIAKRLTAEGIRAPNGGAWNHQNFTSGTVRRGMLSNPIYIGKIEWNRCNTVRSPYTGKPTKKMADPKDLLLVDAPHLRIIDQDLWDKVQAVRAERAAPREAAMAKVKRHGNSIANQHVLSGLVRCAECKSHMVINGKSRSGAPRVVCAVAKANGKCTHDKSYDLGVLLDHVRDFMRANLLDSETLAAVARRMHTKHAEGQRKIEAESRGAEAKLAKVQKQIERVVNALVDSDDVPELKAKLKQLHAERTSLEEGLRLSGARTNVVRLHPEMLNHYKANVERLHHALADQSLGDGVREAFRNLIDCLVVHPTARKAPYDFDVVGRLGAMLGGELFPTGRQGPGNKGKSRSTSVIPGQLGTTEVDQRVIPLGRYVAAA